MRTRHRSSLRRRRWRSRCRLFLERGAPPGGIRIRGREPTPSRGNLLSSLPVSMEHSSLRNLTACCGVLEAPKGVLCSVGSSQSGKAMRASFALAAFPSAISSGWSTSVARVVEAPPLWRFADDKETHPEGYGVGGGVTANSPSRWWPSPVGSCGRPSSE